MRSSTSNTHPPPCHVAAGGNASQPQGGKGADEADGSPATPRSRASASAAPEPAFRQVPICLNKVELKRNPVVAFLERSLGVTLQRGEYATNEIRTAKYTLLTFLPVNLFEQFLRIANLYFLIIAILQLIPGLSTTSWFTTVAPLVIVLAINAIKEAVDDYSRHASDGDINSRTVTVLELGGKETQVAWRDLSVGELVRVSARGRRQGACVQALLGDKRIEWQNG